MKRKVALIISLIMITTMVMTVLIACGDGEPVHLIMHDNSYSTIKRQQDYTLGSEFTLGLNEKKKVELSDSLLSGYHVATIVASKKLSSISATCGGEEITVYVEECNGDYWYSLLWNFDDHSKKSALMEYSGVADVTLPDLKIEMVSSALSTNVKIAYQRQPDLYYCTDNTTSVVWTMSKTPNAVQASPDAWLPDGVYYLTPEDTAFMAYVFNCNQDNFSKMTKKEHYVSAVNSAATSMSSLMEGVTSKDAKKNGYASYVVKYATNVVILAINAEKSAKSMGQALEGVRQELTKCANNGTGCELRLYHSNLAGGSVAYTYTCEPFDFTSTDEFCGVPGVDGEFNE